MMLNTLARAYCDFSLDNTTVAGDHFVTEQRVRFRLPLYSLKDRLESLLDAFHSISLSCYSPVRLSKLLISCVALSLIIRRSRCRAKEG